MTIGEFRQQILLYKFFGGPGVVGRFTPKLREFAKERKGKRHAPIDDIPEGRSQDLESRSVASLLYAFMSCEDWGDIPWSFDREFLYQDQTGQTIHEFLTDLFENPGNHEDVATISVSRSTGEMIVEEGDKQRKFTASNLRYNVGYRVIPKGLDKILKLDRTAIETLVELNNTKVKGSRWDGPSKDT